MAEKRYDKQLFALNTAGHMMTYYQNRQIEENQQEMAKFSLLNTMMLAEQQEKEAKKQQILENKLNYIADLIGEERIARLNSEWERKSREKEKTNVIDLGLQTDVLLKHVEKNINNDLLKSFLLRNAELHIDRLVNERSSVNDYYFFEKLYSFRSKHYALSNDIRSLQINFSDTLADLLLDLSPIYACTLIAGKSYSELYDEHNINFGQYADELISNLKKLNSNSVKLKSGDIIDRLLLILNLKKELIFLNIQPNHTIYPSPVSFDELEGMLAIFTEIHSNPELYIDNLSIKLNNIANDFKGDNKIAIIYFEKFLLTKEIDIKESDLLLLSKYYNLPCASLFKQKVYEKIIHLNKNIAEALILITDIKKNIYRDTYYLSDPKKNPIFRDIDTFSALMRDRLTEVNQEDIANRRIGLIRTILLFEDISSEKEAYHHRSNDSIDFLFLILFIAIMLVVLFPFLISVYLFSNFIIHIEDNLVKYFFTIALFISAITVIPMSIIHNIKKALNKYIENNYPKITSSIIENICRIELYINNKITPKLNNLISYYGPDSNKADSTPKHLTQ